MKTKIRKDQLTKEEMEEFKNKNCKLLSSKQLAELLQVTEGAIRNPLMRKRKKPKNKEELDSHTLKLYKQITILQS